MNLPFDNKVALVTGAGSGMDLATGRGFAEARTAEIGKPAIGVFDSKSLALMKPGVMLINVSRGRLIHTKALIEALKSGHVGGVALDVYEEEEGIFFEDLSGEVLLDDELARLLTFPNVLVTAHQAFFTREALSEISRVTVENIRRFVAKEAFLEGTVL